MGLFLIDFFLALLFENQASIGAFVEFRKLKINSSFDVYLVHDSKNGRREMKNSFATIKTLVFVRQ